MRHTINLCMVTKHTAHRTIVQSSPELRRAFSASSLLSSTALPHMHAMTSLATARGDYAATCKLLVQAVSVFT